MNFSAILVGNESLTSECGEVLLQRGHAIAAVVTGSAGVRQWAEARGLRGEAFGPDLAERIPDADWLVSIANLAVLPPAVPARAGRGAVNFHDAPQRAHAGLNALVWAILAGERDHAITWHLIEGGLDEGRILAQHRFAIAGDDTALTLNTRCFEAGLDRFPALVSRLATGLAPRPQPAVPRLLHRPASFGRIDFALPAADALRLVRALDHGRYWNPLATAKIDTGSQVLNVGTAALAEGAGAPGEVLSAGPERLVVACGAGALRLARLACQISGGAVCPSSITAAALRLLTAAEAARLTAACATAAPRDGAWRRALAGLAPATLPFARASSDAPDWRGLPLAAELPVLALATLRALGLTETDLACAASGLPGYLASWRPLHIAGGGTLAAALAAVAEGLAAPGEGWPLDLMSRDPTLAGVGVPQIGLSGGRPRRHGACRPVAPDHGRARPCARPGECRGEGP